MALITHTLSTFIAENIMSSSLRKIFGRTKLQMTFPGSLRTKTSQEIAVAKKVKMSEYVDLWQTESSDKSLPLVLLFPWLTASTSAIQKYADLYHQRGMDVLVIRGAIRHFLWPPFAFKLGDEIEKCLSEIPSYHNYLVHSFSIGAYNYTIAKMNSKSGVLSFPSEKIIGQIFDSIVIGTTDNMAEGLAISITGKKLFQRAIKKSALTYIQLTRRKTLDVYDESVEFCREKFLPVPSLFFYCENDVMCNLNSMREFIRVQREKFGDNIWEKCWAKSSHAGHLRMHKDEYSSVLNLFLDDLKL